MGRTEQWPFRRARHGFPGWGAAICVRLAPCCLLALAGCGISAAPDDSPEGVEASNVVQAGSGEFVAPPDSTILADRLLRGESGLLLDPGKRLGLAREIERTLVRIRGAHPAMADIAVRLDQRPGVLLLGLEPALFKAVSGPPGGDGGSATLQTGHAEFDALNARLGLSAVRPFSSTGVVAMYFDERLNVLAASAAYSMIEGVEYAESDFLTGDGSDIEASKSRGAWHVVFRKGWGDCPAGCLYQELSFFTVENGEVERIERARAMAMVAFAEIVANRGWR